jgi:probable DNA metabolism protein
MADLFSDDPAFGEGAAKTFPDAEVPGDPFWKDTLYRVCPRAYDAVCGAWMSGLPVDAHIARYARTVLDAARKAGIGAAASEAADRAACDRGDPSARAVLEAAYKAGHEIHRLKGLLRFSPTGDGLYVARCAPDGFILPALEEHFSLRFGDAQWAIIDEKRNIILIRRSGETAKLEPLSPEFPSQTASSDTWEIFWRAYFRSVTIENRKNPALQRQFVPERYRKYMTEFNSGLFSKPLKI